MKFLLFAVLLYCAVKCDDVGNNYYVIEMPEDVPVNSKKTFKVYWNVPTMQCKSKKIPFNDLYEKYGIIQNKEDEFRGEEITILYEPGLFPAIFKNETSGKYRFRNGGVPQEGSLEEHLKVFKKDMEEIVPDPNFSGVGIIDFESWRPIFRQNFGTLVPYKDVSIEIEKKLHWWWPKTWIQTEAQRRFEEAARRFMQTTLSIAKQMRPNASWGYYGFPHCFNMASVANMNETCPKNVISENDGTDWLWLESTALYPSVYSSSDLSSSQLGLLVRGRVEEACRVRRYDTPIFPYFWFRYRDGGFMKQEDLAVVLKSLYNSNASGFIIWGSSNDVNTVSKCQKLHEYVEKILGPMIGKYLQKINKLNDDQVATPTESNINDLNETLSTVDDVSFTTDPSNINETMDYNNETQFVRKVQFDPEFDWVPPENYSQDISQNVELELLRKGYNSNSNKRIELKKLNASSIVDVIFDVLLNSKHSEVNKQQNIKDVKNETKTTTSTSTTTSEYTESPNISNNENGYITEDPVNIMNEYLRTDIGANDIISSTQLNSETLTRDLKKDSTSEAKVSTEFSLIPTTENQFISSDDAYSKDLKEDSTSKENNLLSNYVSKENQAISEEKRRKNNNENMLMRLIFNALIKHNIIDENNTQSVYTEFPNSDSIKSTELIDQIDTQSEKIYLDTTQKSINEMASDKLTQSGLANSLESFEIAKDIISDITSTTDATITAEDGFDLISSEGTSLSSNFKKFSTEEDDFLTVIKNYTDTSTQKIIKQIDYENDDLITSSANLTNTNTTKLNDDDQSVDASTIGNLSEIILNDTQSNINSEEIKLSNQTESSTDTFVINSDNSERLEVSTNASEVSDSTTEATKDQVMVSRNVAYGSKLNSMYLFVYSSFIFINNVFIT